MAYGILKVDTITFTDGGVDKSVPVSGLVQNPTFTGNITATGTISGNIIQGGTTVSGVTVTGTTANFASGVFTTQVSGLLITGPTVSATTGTFTSLTGTTTNGTTASFTTGNFTSLTGTTTTGTTANFASGVFTTQVSGVTVIATTGTFTSLTGTTTNGTTASFTTGNFTSLTGTTTTGTTANFASGVFTTQISGVTVIATTGTFTSLTGTTTTMTSGVFASGTEPLPSISFVSDPNTGIYSPGADQLAVATNGTQRINIESDGDINIDGGGVFYDATNNRLGIGNTTSGFTNNLIIGSGTGDNGATIYADTASFSILHFADGSSGADRYRGGIVYNHANNSFNFATNDTSAVTIDSSQRLLVGTTNTIAGATDSLLQIRGNSSGTQFAGKVALATEVAVASIVSGTDLGAIYFGNTANGVGGLIECKGDAQWSTAGGGDYPGRLVFSTTPDGSASPTERMRIKADGDVSIVTGNLIIGTAGKGIDFSADGQAAGMTSELLDDYEEGTWTPTQGAGLTVVGTFTSAGHYTKVGRQVTVQGFVRGSTSVASAGGSVFCSGLPFAVQNVNDTNFIGSGADGTLTGLINIWIDRNQAGVYSVTSSAVTASIYFTGSYFTP